MKRFLVLCSIMLIIFGTMPEKAYAAAASPTDADQEAEQNPEAPEAVPDYSFVSVYSAVGNTYYWNPDGEDAEKKYFAALHYDGDGDIFADGWYTFAGDEGEVVLFDSGAGYQALTYNAMFYTGVNEVWSIGDQQTIAGFLSGSLGLGSSAWELQTTNMKVFSSYDAAMVYLQNGSLDGLLHDGFNNFQYDERIGFEDFRVELHASNSPKKYFIRFYYTPTQYLLDNGGTCEVQIDYEYEESAIFGIYDKQKHADGGVMLDLSKDHYDFFPYDFLYPIDSSLARMFSGIEALGVIDSEDLSVGGVGGESLGKVTSSVFYFSFIPSCSGVNGNNFKAFVDCLDNSSESFFEAPNFNEESDKYVDDYTPIKDTYTSTRDYYYTKVSKDSYDNDVYNYYYINNFGISTEISNDGSGSTVGGSGISGSINHNISGSLDINIIGSSSGSDIPPVIIEDDDYSDGRFIDDVSNLWGLVDDMDTAAEDDGPIRFLVDALKFLPSDLNGMMGYGVSIVIIVSILRAVFKR